MKHLIALYALVMLCRVNGNSQETVHGDDIRKSIELYGQAEVSIVYPGFEALTHLASHYSISSCDGKQSVLILSPLTAELFIRDSIQYTIHFPEPTKGFYTAKSAAEAMNWKSYPTLKQYDTILFNIARDWSSVCLIDTIGFSVLGRPVIALKITDNPTENENEPAVLLSAGIHGDELAGFVLLMRLAEYLASESNNGGLPETLVSGLELWITPLTNPDGMYNKGDVINYPIRTNINGYDLNRNFPDPEMVSPPPLQPETIDMIHFLMTKRFVLSASLHSGKEVVDYPWDKWTRVHADNNWFYEICRRYADTVHLYAEKGYMTEGDNGVTRGSISYIMRGGRQDFITYSYAGRELTIEIDDTKLTAGPKLDFLWNWNKRSLLRFLEQALYGLQGIVTDSKTGLPLAAKIFVNNHDRDSSHVYADTLNGSYYRYLANGIWPVTFSCNGYYSFTAENTRVLYDRLTTLDIQLVPLGTSINEPKDQEFHIYPNPASGGEIIAMLPVTFSGDIIVTISSITGAIIDAYRTAAIPDLPLIIPCTNLSSGIYILSVKKIPQGPVISCRIIITD